MSSHTLRSTLLGLGWLGSIALLGCGAVTSADVEATTPDATNDANENPAPSAPTRLECSFEGEPGERYARDCDREITLFEERTTAALGGLEQLEAAGAGKRRFGQVRAALSTLVERRRQICADWNACASSRDDHLDLYDWLSDEVAAFDQRLQAVLDAPNDATAGEALRQWAQGLTSRRPRAHRAPESVAAVPTPNANPVVEVAPAGPPLVNGTPALPEEARRRIENAIRQQEQEVVEVQELLDIVRRIRAKAQGASISVAPPLCRAKGAPPQRLAEMVREPNFVVSGQARTLSTAITDICERYARRDRPNERVLSSIGRLFAHLDRVDGWMDDILRCHQPGADQRRCSNAFGARQADDIEQARRVKRLVADLRRSLAGVRDGRRPFPCELPLWSEIASQQWTLSVARAQMPMIERNATNVCRAIGLDARGLERSLSSLAQRLDSTESSLGTYIRVRRDGIARLRMYLP